MPASTSARPHSPLTKARISQALRKPRKARTLNRDAALAMRQAGHTMPQIAAKLGVTTSAVYKFLDKATPEHQALEAFKQNRANVFADLQAKAIELQRKVIDSFYENGVLVTLTPQQKTGLMMSLNAVSGTIYDKERLELGKSTQNVGLIARMMGDSLGRIGKATSNGGDPAPETPGE